MHFTNFFAAIFALAEKAANFCHPAWLIHWEEREVCTPWILYSCMRVLFPPGPISNLSSMLKWERAKQELRSSGTNWLHWRRAQLLAGCWQRRTEATKQGKAIIPSQFGSSSRLCNLRKSQTSQSNNWQLAGSPNMNIRTVFPPPHSLSHATFSDNQQCHINRYSQETDISCNQQQSWSCLLIYCNNSPPCFSHHLKKTKLTFSIVVAVNQGLYWLSSVCGLFATTAEINIIHSRHSVLCRQSECDIDLSFLAAVTSQGTPRKPGPSFVSHTLTDCLQETSFRKVKIQLDALSFLAPA